MKNYPLKPGVLRYFGLPPKILLIMKLIIIMLFTCLMQVSAGTMAQRITLNQRNATLENVLKQVRTQSGYNFIYNADLLDAAKAVTINIKDATVEEALKEIIKNQQLSYSIKDKTIILEAKAPSFLDKVGLVIQSAAKDLMVIDISGTVVDDKGIPLPGATVKARGAKTVITDIKGRFMLEGVQEGATVTISFTGYVTQELPAKQAMGVIKMALSENPLDQVQVIAYGTQTKRYSLGNVVSVKAADIEKQPVQNPLLALQGRVAGLEITQANGLNGSGVTVRVQGTNSIRNGTDPLIIIDGVPYASQNLTTTNVGANLLGYSGDLNSPASRGGAGNPLNYINPSDIESIEVLKDADATAIYGSRAANGAILITTKKGKAGDTQFDVNLQQGWGHVRKFMDLLNTQQYLEMRREAFKNDGLQIPSILTNPNNTDYDINGQWDINGETDWQKELIGGTAKYQNAILTVSGGSNVTNFRLSGTYSRMGTVFPDGGNGNPSGNLNFSISSTSVNQKFNIQFSGSYMNNVNRLPGSDLTQTAVRMAPNAPSLYSTDGSLNWDVNPAGRSTAYNPLAYMEAKYKNKTTNMVSSMSLGYKILPELEIKANVGYTNQQINEFYGSPLTIYAPQNRLVAEPNKLRFAQYSYNNRNSWNVEPQLSYRRDIGLHHFNLLIGGTLQQNNGNGLPLTGIEYPNDSSLENAYAAITMYVGNTVIPTYKYLGAFSRINYQFKDRYLINFTLRRDGSTRFGTNSRFHNFGSISGGWIFSEENLIKKNLPFLTFGKLRASFGTTGNDQIEDYLYLSLVNTSSATVYQGIQGYNISRLANAYLEWEENKKIQIGIDLGFFKERIFFSANYVKNRTSNQLLPYNLPSIAGYTEIESNFPATLQNKGLEFSLQTVNLKSKSFNWKTSFNFSALRNKLVEFENLENSTYASLLILDKPFNIVKRAQYIGVDPITGLYQVLGKNGPTSDLVESIRDATVFDPNPKYYGGMQNSISYKNLLFDFSLSFARKTAPRYFGGGRPGGFSSGRGNQEVSVLKRWQNSGDKVEHQKFSQNSTSNGTYFLMGLSDRYYTDASFVSLKNVSLSYLIPSSFVSKISLKSVRIYTHAQNLWTLTKYKGFDPESPGSGLPPLRVITVGIQASL